MTKRIRKKYCIRKKKCLFENDLFFGLLIFLFLIIGSVYLLFFHSFFQINSVVIENSFTLDKEELVDYFEQITTQKVFLFSSKSIIPLSTNKIRNNVLSQTSVIKDIKITKIFPSQLKVNLIERVPIAFLCKTKENCYYIDKEGIVFQKSPLIGKNIIIINKNNFLIGEKVVASKDLQQIFYLKKELEKIGLAVDYFTFSKKNSLEIVLQDRWSIFFSNEKYVEELKNLKLILEKFSSEAKKEINYIDLRFGDRIYYK